MLSQVSLSWEETLGKETTLIQKFIFRKPKLTQKAHSTSTILISCTRTWGGWENTCSQMIVLIDTRYNVLYISKPRPPGYSVLSPARYLVHSITYYSTYTVTKMCMCGWGSLNVGCNSRQLPKWWIASIESTVGYVDQLGYVDQSHFWSIF